ncbi:hypothetical protein CMV_022784 [Castanea mollissima]|uniref:Uncharacterized protein n=1 Tax=Castanea mollissima TaxID=60419 RepID=A0A8J4V7N3_9ROSI|nr:hypothetical protein CMV_022784 [Castanea mollissima]
MVPISMTSYCTGTFDAIIMQGNSGLQCQPPSRFDIKVCSNRWDPRKSIPKLTWAVLFQLFCALLRGSLAQNLYIIRAIAGIPIKRASLQEVATL